MDQINFEAGVNPGIAHPRNPRFVVTTIIVLLAFGAIAWNSYAQSPPKEGGKNPVADEIRARKLVVVGADEKSLMEFGSSEGKAPIFIMKNAAGNRRLAATITPDGTASLVLSDTHGKTRSMMSVNKAGEPQLLLKDSDGKTRGNLMIQKDGTCAFDLRDKNGNTRLTMQIDDKGQPALVIFDTEGKPTWSAPQP